MIKGGQNQRKILETIQRLWKWVKMYKVFKRFHCTNPSHNFYLLLCWKTVFLWSATGSHWGIARRSLSSYLLNDRCNGFLSSLFSEAIYTSLLTHSTGKQPNSNAGKISITGEALLITHRHKKKKKRKKIQPSLFARRRDLKKLTTQKKKAKT